MLRCVLEERIVGFRVGTDFPFTFWKLPLLKNANETRELSLGDLSDLHQGVKSEEVLLQNAKHLQEVRVDLQL